MKIQNNIYYITIYYITIYYWLFLLSRGAGVRIPPGSPKK